MLVTDEQIVKKRRSKGERTKHLILESAIAVLAAQGIKGATHRAIASHANIQLSLTTYYFKDIQELVRQAFELNAANIIHNIAEQWQPIIDLVDGLSKADLRRVSVRVELREKLTPLISNMITANISNNPQQLIVEKQLFSEMHVTPELVFISQQLQLAQLQPCLQLCQYFAQDDIEINAEILLSQIQNTGYRQLQVTTPINDNDILKTIHQILAIIIRIKP